MTVLPILTLSTTDLLHPFETVLSLHVSIDATGKRKIDGSKAASRLGSSATEKWGNERFRQTMLLVREFRMEWPNTSLLTADDVESIRSLLDCALYTATKTGHVSDIYDMNPTCWAIWLVQNQQALKAGGWNTHSAVTQQAISFEGLYNWLKAQHGKHENRNLYDQVTKKRLKQYKFPFKAFTVPPVSTNLFKYIKGARRLSDWVYGCQESMDAQDRPRLMGFPYGIIAQKPPEVIAAPPLADAAIARRQAVWERVRARAHRQSMGLRTAQDGSEDAEQTRELVDAIVEESGKARDRETESTEGGGPSMSLNDIQHALMEDSEEEEEGGSGAGPSAAGGEGGGAGSSTEEPPPALPAQPPSHNTEGGEGFSAYELERRENIRRNELHLESLGLLHRVLPAPRPAPRPPPHVPEGPTRSSHRVAKLPRPVYTHADVDSD